MRGRRWYIAQTRPQSSPHGIHALSFRALDPSNFTTGLISKQDLGRQRFSHSRFCNQLLSASPSSAGESKARTCDLAFYSTPSAWSWSPPPSRLVRRRRFSSFLALKLFPQGVVSFCSECRSCLRCMGYCAPREAIRLLKGRSVLGMIPIRPVNLDCSLLKMTEDS